MGPRLTLGPAGTWRASAFRGEDGDQRCCRACGKVGQPRPRYQGPCVGAVLFVSRSAGALAIIAGRLALAARAVRGIRFKKRNSIERGLATGASGHVSRINPLASASRAPRAPFGFPPPVAWLRRLNASRPTGPNCRPRFLRVPLPEGGPSSLWAPLGSVWRTRVAPVNVVAISTAASCPWCAGRQRMWRWAAVVPIAHGGRVARGPVVLCPSPT
ncbi:unnamed protein product [Amoebophrya sp. A120]|nr:unnamed protein product [Amoebophrya sp. A120]|eukprot:GSA120T00020675001.1